MGLFRNKKSNEEKQHEKEINELLSKLDGKLLSNSPRFDYIAYNYVEIGGFGDVIFSIRNLKAILKKEMMNEKLSKDHLEERIIELLQLDWEKIFSNSHKIDDTSIFTTQDDVINYFGEKYKHEKFLKKQAKIKKTHIKYKESQLKLKNENIAKNDFNNEIKRVMNNGYYKCKFGYFKINKDRTKEILESEIKKGLLPIELIEDRVNELIDNNNNPNNPSKSPIKYCGNCGAKILEGSKFCSNCGNKLILPKNEINDITLRKSSMTNENNNNNESQKVKFTQEQQEKILKIKIEDMIEVKVGYLSILIDTSEMAENIRNYQEIVRKNEPCEPHIFIKRNEEFNSKLETDTKLLENQITEYESLFNKIINNENLASKLKYRSDEEELEAIKLYKENISFGICCNSFYELSSLYNQRKEYDQGICVAEKGLKLFAESGKPTRNLEHELNHLKDNKEKDAFMKNHQMAMNFEEEGKIDEAIEMHLKNTKLNLDYINPYSDLGRLYHYKQEFEKEKEIYKVAIAREEQMQEKSDFFNPSRKIRYEKDLENVESFLNTGKWKYDCLPADPKPIYYEIKEAKTLIKGEEKEKGIEMLEKIIEKGSYSNTAYNTLYQTYNKDKKFDDSIRICEKAIEVLGLFSNDRKYRWTINLDKANKRKEKSEK